MLHPTPIPDRGRNSGWNVISHCRFFSLSLQGLRNQMVWGGKKNTPPYRLHIQSYMQPQGLPVDRSFSAWGFVCTYVWVCLSCSFLLLPFGGALRKEYLWRISHFSKETKRRTFPGEEEEWHQMDKACQNLSRGHSGARPFCRMCLYRWSVASIRIFSFCFCVCVSLLLLLLQHFLKDHKTLYETLLSLYDYMNFFCVPYWTWCEIFFSLCHFNTPNRVILQTQETCIKDTTWSLCLCGGAQANSFVWRLSTTANDDDKNK